jgi:hypothetical protein
MVCPKMIDIFISHFPHLMTRKNIIQYPVDLSTLDPSQSRFLYIDDLALDDVQVVDC